MHTMIVCCQSSGSFKMAMESFGTQENFCILALLFSYSLNYIVEINVLISLKVLEGKSNENEFSFFPTTWDLS